MPKIEDPFPGPTMFNLRGKQSVRATFKISQRAIDAIGMVAVHMGIKQKSLFDHIIEDLEALDALAQTIQIRKFKQIERKQKTYVLSRKTIDALEAISETYGMPRDALVEYSVQKLGSIISSEKLKHEERKILQKEITDYFDHGRLLYQKAVSILGEDDPFCRRIEKALLACRKTEEDINDFLEKSKVLEGF
ncbi:MAG: hypothetical protein A3J85_02130 [Desulfobacula sp. RIFOXYA12_FULL_46_16]|nr:MAG: hypothetical protein A2464_08790 [Deltaproteobacteria bacterium RIFOXYC2_FULL_48_10]OGR20473.1 MAG: hypothetical protein A3J85_02130 [Desulfobacula sp. RIFOXYA12_FULL_46_16]OGR38716.1 MAG: hypothetical protein A3J80_06850 [Desulfobacula sp. RIFOXYB2_FULL_45_6]